MQLSYMRLVRSGSVISEVFMAGWFTGLTHSASHACNILATNHPSLDCFSSLIGLPVQVFLWFVTSTLVCALQSVTALTASQVVSSPEA